MEFDSEEEREIFGESESDESEDIESSESTSSDEAKPPISVGEGRDNMEDQDDESNYAPFAVSPREEDTTADMFSEDYSMFSIDKATNILSSSITGPPDEDGIRSPMATPPDSPPLDATASKSCDHEKRENKKKMTIKNRRRCDECEGCLRQDDCRKCRYCVDMKKYGGQGRLRQKCIKRQCLKLSRVLHLEATRQHSDPPSSSSMRMKPNTQLSLDIINNSLLSGGNSNDVQANSLIGTSQPFYVSSDKTPSSKDVVSSRPHKKSTKKPTKRQPIKKKDSIKKRRHHHGNDDDDSDDDDDDDDDDGGVSDEEYMFKGPSRKRERIDRHGYDRGWSPVDQQKQCLGPGCMYAASPHSKYCSEECGIELATRRIQTLLPQCKELWDMNDEPFASKLNKDKLAQLEQEQLSLKKRLEQLDNQSEVINRHINSLKNEKPIKEDEVGEDTEDLLIYCATCSHPVGLKKALVHMERCFTKLEGTVSFGSIVKNDGIDIFCDKYDRSQGTYCKRLKVLCPEHTKEPKIGPNDICGCPLSSAFPSVEEKCLNYCRHSKKKCISHYCWEKLRRAEIDQEKLNLYLKLEEVGEQVRLYQWQISYRRSLFAILLHHTIDHSKSHDNNMTSSLKSHDHNDIITQ